MAEWEAITLGEPEVESDPQYAAMVVVRVPFTPQPDEAWLDIFNSGPPPGVTYGIASPFPRAGGRSVAFRCAPSDVAKQFDQAKRWAEGTNARYEQDVIPERERQRVAAERDAEERRKAVEEARRQLGQGD